MEILGVLLGITMSTLAWVMWSVNRELVGLRKDLIEGNERAGAINKQVAALLHRRDLAAATPVAPEAQSAPKLRYRTWNEDAVMPEKSN
jgi:hypothetical protein